MSSIVSDAKECKMSPVSNRSSDFQVGYESCQQISQRRHFVNNMCLESENTEGIIQCPPVIHARECQISPKTERSDKVEAGYEDYPTISQRRHFPNMCLESEEHEGISINTHEYKTDTITERSSVGDKRHFPEYSIRSVFIEDTPTRDARIEKEHGDREDYLKETERRHFSESEETEGIAINTHEYRTGTITERSSVGDKRYFPEYPIRSVFIEDTPTRDARIEKEHSDREDYLKGTERRHFSESEVTEDFSIYVQGCKISPVTERSPPGEKRHFAGKSASSVFEEETPTRDARIEKEIDDRMDF